MVDQPETRARGRLAVAVRQVPGVAVCAVRCYLRGGAYAEPIPGASALAARLLAEGTDQRSWERLAVDLERRGMSLSTQGAGEAHGLMLDALAVDWEQALETVAELVFHSTFDQERFEWQRQQTLAEIESLADQAEVVAGRAFMEQLYHPHPAGRLVLGDAESLASLDAGDCARFHREGLERGVVLAVAGQIEEARVERRIEDLFGRLEGEIAPRRAPPPAVGLGARREVPVPARDQSHLFVGHLTVDRAHPDLPALEVLGVVLGAGDGLFGRIPNRVREQEGLAYSVQVGVASGAGTEAGRLVVYVATADATAALAEAAIREELERVASDGVAAVEVEAARGYVLGREPFRRETARQWADLLAESLFYRIPYDDPGWIRRELERVDVAAVREAARRHVRPDDLRVTLGRPRASIGGPGSVDGEASRSARRT
ncbi:MAG TPA: pitrilysin family protein [Thermoanaerobaculia bacterium]|nr:pitrilysin family protein [Thermoanaerobaculia bacterium]